MDTNAIDYPPKHKTAIGVVRLFRGDIPLPITFWVFGILIGNVLPRAMRIMIELNSLAIFTNIGARVVQGVSFLFLAYSIFMLVATWRSADKYKGSALWTALARISVSFSLLLIIANIYMGIETIRNPDDALVTGISVINKSLPRMIDDDVRLDHIAVQGRDIHYKYTLVNYAAADLDLSMLKSEMTAQMESMRNTDEEVRRRLNDGRKLVYIYYDKDGHQIERLILEK